MKVLDLKPTQIPIQTLENLIVSYCVMKQQCLEKLVHADSIEVTHDLQTTITQCEATIATLRRMLTIMGDTNNFSK